MRATLKYFLARLGLVAFATLGLHSSLAAHDLPDARALAAVPAAAPQPHQLIAVALPDEGAAPRPGLSPAQPHAPLIVARPAIGSAPRPAVKVAQSAPPIEPAAAASISVRAGEVYMPYDFQLSDWRFGQFPYHGLTATAPSPQSLPSLARDAAGAQQPAVPALSEATLSQADVSAASKAPPTVRFGPPTPQAAALGELLRQVDEWQCAAYSILSDGASLARAAERGSQSLGRWVVNYRRADLPAASATISAAAEAAVSAEAAVPAVAQPSPSVGPQYVVYDAAHGGHIVLTVEQARDWQFEAPVSHSRVQAALGAAFKPLQSSALATASRQLELAGRGLLSLSHSLSRIASGTQSEAKVASLPSRKD